MCFVYGKGCPWSSGGGGAQKCPKTGAVGSKAQCTGCNKSGSNSGKSSKQNVISIDCIEVYISEL